jgi:hypothetical protein
MISSFLSRVAAVVTARQPAATARQEGDGAIVGATCPRPLSEQLETPWPVFMSRQGWPPAATTTIRIGADSAQTPYLVFIPHRRRRQPGLPALVGALECRLPIRHRDAAAGLVARRDALKVKFQYARQLEVKFKVLKCNSGN